MPLIFSSLLILSFAFTILICTFFAKKISILQVNFSKKVDILQENIASAKRHECRHAKQSNIYQKHILDILKISHPEIFMEVAKRQIAND